MLGDKTLVEAFWMYSKVVSRELRNSNGNEFPAMGVGRTHPSSSQQGSRIIHNTFYQGTVIYVRDSGSSVA